MMRQTGNFFAAFFLLSMVSFNGLCGSNWTFKAIPDTNRIRIGEQFSVFLQARVPAGQKVIFPSWNDSIMKGFELVAEGKTDTLTKDADVLTLRRRWQLTAFDSGYFPVPPLIAKLAKNQGDSSMSEAFLVYVQTVKVDTSAAIKPIKGPHDPDFAFSEWWKEIVIAILILVLLALFVWFRNRRKKKINKPAETVVKTIPLDWALREFDLLRKENFTGRGMVKEYYVRLSEIIRNFIEMELGIPALESTTDEIVSALRLKGIPDATLLSIQAVMQLCDLAKFAKANPQHGEHEGSYQNAMEFVQVVSRFNKIESGNTPQ